MTWIPEGEPVAAPVPLRASTLTDPEAYIPQNPDWSLTDGEWSTLTTAEGDTLALHEGDPYGFADLSPGVHEARARLRVSATTHVHVDVTWRGVDGAEYVMPDGPAETIPAGESGTLHRTWKAPAGAASGSIAFRFQASPGSTVRVGDLVWAAHDVDAPVVIVADQIIGGHFTGETFEGGAFVGGEFRTSDNLPGRVTLANDAYVNSASGTFHPGIRVEPLDMSTVARPPGIGPAGRGVYVDGGRDTSGRRSHLFASPDAAQVRTSGGNGEYGVVQTSPTESLMRTWSAKGEVLAEVSARTTAARLLTWGESRDYGWIDARAGSAELAYVESGDTYFSLIRADTNSAFLFSQAGGVNRYLEVDADGIWVRTERDGTLRSYNLEDVESRLAALEARISALEG